MKRSLKPVFLFLLQLQVFSAVDGHFRETREASFTRLQNGVIMASSSSKYQPTSTESSLEREPTLVSKFWPPFPFDRLGKRGRAPGERSSDGSKAYSVWESVKKRTTVSVRQCREIGASLYCHLPPALPPVILLASFPKQVMVNNRVADATEAASRKIVPLFSVPFVRNLALGGLVVTLISWGDAELHRKRQLTPILEHRSVSRASVTLPPFLPEEISDEEDEQISFGDEIKDKQAAEQLGIGNGVAKLTERAESFYTNWKRTRDQQKVDALNARRKTIYKQLVALQASKKQNARKANSADASSKTTGFALVTGASTGIGRALATELARWGISLILVARNEKALMSLADDLNKCYGVQCIALPADLSVADAAESIHETTTKNGLTVDILVNNAGIATSGPAVDTSMDSVQNILFVNALSSVKLAILYSRDMVQRRKGRILNVSSMAGLASSVPNASVYGASKAFLKSLSLSMSKELESSGIGVTTLMPGAVTTNFRHSSGMENALCWRLPYYARPVELVAHLGIASLLDGDAEIVPGLLNRLFAKVARPLLPRRLEAICIEAAFKPLAFPQLGPRKDKTDKKDYDTRLIHGTPPNPRTPPKLLQLENRSEPERSSIEEIIEKSETTPSETETVSNQAEKINEPSEDAVTGPEQTKKDTKALQVKETREETKEKVMNRDDSAPSSPKKSSGKPNLMLQESLLQNEKLEF